MDIEKTRRYYDSLTDDDLCDCDSCRNFRMQIRETYPRIAEYLDTLGIDIAKPFETWSIELENGELLYPETMYLILGEPSGSFPVQIDDIDVHLTDSHPYVDMDDPHFVIELSSFRLKDLRIK